MHRCSERTWSQARAAEHRRVYAPDGFHDERRLVHVNEMPALLRDDELTIRRELSETMLAVAPTLFHRRSHRRKRYAVCEKDQRPIAERSGRLGLAGLLGRVQHCAKVICTGLGMLRS